MRSVGYDSVVAVVLQDQPFSAVPDSVRVRGIAQQHRVRKIEDITVCRHTKYDCTSRILGTSDI
jgi:hypothetical protein